MATDARGGRRWEGINMALRLSGCKLRVLRVPLASGRLGRTDGRTDGRWKTAMRNKNMEGGKVLQNMR